MIPWWLSAIFALGAYAYGYFYGRALLWFQLRDEIEAVQEAIAEANESLANGAELFHAMREEWDKEDNDR